jgi:hypothetical protein
LTLVLRSAARAAPTDRRRFTTAVSTAGVLSLLVYIQVLGGGRFDLKRTAVPGGFFSNIFDLQARAMMDGHLDLRRGSIAIESFIVDGRTYTYFPPWPSLLRMPFFLITDDLDGRFTGISMLLATIVTMAATAGLLWRVRFLVRGTAPMPTWEAAAHGIVVAAVSVGSVNLFLASLPWAYHEVYAWSIATVAVTVWAMVGVLEQATIGNVSMVFVGALLVNLTRSTTGWGCCAALFVCAWHARRNDRRLTNGRRVWGWLVAAGLAAFVAGSIVTWIKFGSPTRFLPLENQVWTQVNAQRRRAMAANGGGLTNIAFLPTTLLTYLSPFNIRLLGRYPFISLPASPPPVIGDVVFDQTYRTGSATAFMPLLFILALIGVRSLITRDPVGWSRRLAIPLFGTAIAFGGVLNYGYLANRYTSDFMPFFIMGSALGVVHLCHTVELSERRRRVPLMLTFMGALGIWGVAANAAAGATAMSLIGGAERLHDYVERQIDVGNVDDLVHRSPSVPATAPADTIQIVGDCDAVFVGTGETFEPWALAGGRTVAAEIEVPDDAGAAVEPLVTFAGTLPADVSFELDGEGQARLVGGTSGDNRTGWFVVPPDGVIELQVGADPTGSSWVVSGPTPDIVIVSTSAFDEQWFRWMRVPDVETGRSRRVGDLTIEWREVSTDEICSRFGSDASP